MKIFVIGSGSWGSALAQICVDNGHDVLIYGNCADEINEINASHTNSKYFPNVTLNENLKGTLNLEDVKDARAQGDLSENFEYNCTGSVTLNGVTFRCHKREGHGVLNMAQAVAYSCNTYFLQRHWKQNGQTYY